MRVLVVDGRVSSTIKSGLASRVHATVCKRSPGESFPTTPTTIHARQRHEVREHVCSAAEMDRFATNIDHRHRCLGEMRVTSPQTNSSSITSPSTSTLRSRSFAGFRRHAFWLVETFRTIHAIDRGSDSRHRHAQDTFGLSKLLAKIAVTRLTRHLFKHDFGRRRFHGRQCAMFDEPNTTTDGVPTAAAMCAMPLSLPTNSCERAASAVTSGSDKVNVTTFTDASERRLFK